MSDPADRMAGCMRGASDSRLKVESGEGMAKEFAVTTASICSIDDCIILARAFKSAKAFDDTLPRSTLSDSSSPLVNVKFTLAQGSGRWMSLIGKRDRK
jgi:hypothetical protein